MVSQKCVVFLLGHPVHLLLYHATAVALQQQQSVV